MTGPEPTSRVLLFGTPRSGTTWVAEVLGATAHAALVSEPDHANAGDFAVRAAKGRGRTMVLRAGDVAPRDYRRLWDAVLGDGPGPRVPGAARLSRRVGAPVSAADRRAVWDSEAARPSLRHRAALALAQPPRVPEADHVVVKTVVGVLAVDWLLDRYRPRAAWIRRHPLDVVAARRAMAMDVDLERLDRAMTEAGLRPGWCPPPPADPIARQSWYVGLTMSWCGEIVAARPEVVVATHEALCVDPGGFVALAGSLGLEWDATAARVLADSDGPGEGWSTRRVTAAEPGKWRRRLTPDEQRVAIAQLRAFPVAAEHPELA